MHATLPSRPLQMNPRRVWACASGIVNACRGAKGHGSCSSGVQCQKDLDAMSLGLSVVHQVLLQPRHQDL